MKINKTGYFNISGEFNEEVVKNDAIEKIALEVKKFLKEYAEDGQHFTLNLHLNQNDPNDNW